MPGANLILCNKIQIFQFATGSQLVAEKKRLHVSLLTKRKCSQNYFYHLINISHIRIILGFRLSYIQMYVHYGFEILISSGKSNNTRKLTFNTPKEI